MKQPKNSFAFDSRKKKPHKDQMAERNEIGSTADQQAPKGGAPQSKYNKVGSFKMLPRRASPAGNYLTPAITQGNVRCSDLNDEGS